MDSGVLITSSSNVYSSGLYEGVTNTYTQRESCYTTICGFPLIILSLAGIQEARKPIKKGLVIPSPFFFVSK